MPGKKLVKSKPTRGKYDWHRIERLFIEGVESKEGISYPTLKELSDQESIPYQTVRQRSSEFRWPDKRQAHQVEITRAAQKRRIATLGKNAVDFDEKAFRLANVGIALVTTRLAEMFTEHQQMKPVRDQALADKAAGLPFSKEDTYSPIFHRELESLANTAATFQQIGMRGLGTDVNRVELTGEGGGPIQTTSVQVGIELMRDDDERLSKVTQIIQALSGGVLPEELTGSEQEDDDEDTEEAEYDPEDGEPEYVEGEVEEEPSEEE